MPDAHGYKVHRGLGGGGLLSSLKNSLTTKVSITKLVNADPIN